MASNQVEDATAKALVGLRLAALMVKRQRDLDGAMKLLRRLDGMATTGVNNFAISEADGLAMRALVLNLQALIEVYSDRMLDAVATMERAARIMPEDGLVRIGTDIADRYRAQVRANVAQAQYLAGLESEAVAAANRHASRTRGEHPYSLSEALTVAAYFNEVTGDHTMALSYCHEAERLLVREGAPLRLANCRRIAVAAYAGVGKMARSEKLARTLAKDPLGERFLV
jgi:ATP/maltotriose-dependent transcriptional regulator MalT